ncbi:MAG: hypothetical protein JSU93_08195, partial [Methanobacteriota archaeon]
PFRTAHSLVKELAEAADGNEQRFKELAKERLAVHSKKIDAGDLDFLSIERSIEKRTADGGTAPASVKRQREEAAAAMKENEALLKSMRFETNVIKELLE